MFIGREQELEILRKAYEKRDGQLVILYGRRRVGKTETLIHFCEDKRSIFYSCAECSNEQQLEMFSARILDEKNPASKYIDRFQDWNMLFSNLSELSENEEEKLVVVIDEFPYMVHGDKSIPSILQNLWDHELSHRNIMLILCGSAMSFMEKEILAEKNPLYGRASVILKMTEMDYLDACKFVPNFSLEDKIAAYAVLGGIPYYLKLFDDRISLAENVMENILTPGAVLYSEVDFLLRQELRETGIYNSIIQAVALGNTKINDIYQKTGIEKTKLSSYLKNLMELGIIWREFAVDSKLKEQANVNRGFYRITDNYFRFWYTYVFPNRSELERGDASGIWRYAVEDTLNEFVSYSFEQICWQYLRCQNQKDLLPFHFTRIGHWWNKKNEEVDIVASDFRGSKYLIGECKYRNRQMTVKDLTHLQAKFSEGEYEKYWFLFSKDGFSEELKRIEENQEVRLIEIGQLFE